MKKRKPLTEEEKKFSVDRFGITILDEFGDLIEYDGCRYRAVKNPLDDFTSSDGSRRRLTIGNCVFTEVL